jgi:hypothetical protein
VLLFQLVALGTKLVDLFEHPLQQRICRGCGDARPLQLADFTALPLNLHAHPLNFRPDII